MPALIWYYTRSTRKTAATVSTSREASVMKWLYLIECTRSGKGVASEQAWVITADSAADALQQVPGEDRDGVGPRRNPIDGQ
jgi:hypothetical protein